MPNAAALAVLLLVSMAACEAIAEAQVRIANFSAAEPGAVPPVWRLAKLPLVKPTQFRLARIDGSTALRMDAANAAAALYRETRIDPEVTPMLRWRWRVDTVIGGADLRSREGDDLPARLYVMFDYPLEKLSLIERARIMLARAFAGDLVPAAALCYVWDGRLPAGTSLWNPYTARVRVIVARSGTRHLGQWVAEERDVAADFRAAFGEPPPPVSGVALGADTDQTGASARGWFGDIVFASR